MAKRKPTPGQRLLSAVGLKCEGRQGRCSNDATHEAVTIYFRAGVQCTIVLRLCARCYVLWCAKRIERIGQLHADAQVKTAAELAAEMMATHPQGESQSSIPPSFKNR